MHISDIAALGKRHTHTHGAFKAISPTPCNFRTNEKLVKPSNKTHPHNSLDLCQQNLLTNLCKHHFNRSFTIRTEKHGPE